MKKKIIIFSLLYQFLFSILSLLLIMIKEKFGSELFAYALYFNILYFVIGLLACFVIIKFLLRIKNIKIIHLYIYFFLLSILAINIYVYFISQKVLILDIFDIKNDEWYISLSYHLSILLSVTTMYFLTKKKIYLFLGNIKY